MKTTIALGIVAITLAGILNAGEQDKAKAIPAKEWQSRYMRVGMAETVRYTKFLGIKNGHAEIEVHEMNVLTLTKKWNSVRYQVKLADLEPGFRAEVEKADAELKKSADASNAKGGGEEPPR